jgi:hypothetical protein
MLVLVLVLHGATSAPGQQGSETVTITPGGQLVDGSFIRGAHNRWNVLSLEMSDASGPWGTWTDRIEIIQQGGRPVIRRTQVDAGKDRTITFVNLTDQRTMRPISTEIVTSQGIRNRWQFKDGSVHLSVSRPGKDGKPVLREQEIRLSRPVFDFLGGMYGLLLVGFPLREGYSARLPIFHPQVEGGVAWVTYKVERRESVPAGRGKKVEAWTLQVRSTDRDDAMVFSLTKEPPYVIRLRQLAEGTLFTYDMV